MSAVEAIGSAGADPESFARLGVTELPGLVASDITTLSVCDLKTGRHRVVGKPGVRQPTELGPRRSGRGQTRGASLRILFRRIGAFGILCALIATSGAFAQSAPKAGSKLTVSGNVETKLTLGVDDLQRLAVQRVEDVRQVRMAGATAKDGEQTRRYTGVLLRDVLTSAKPIEKERHDLRRSIVVVTASDGYQAVFSWAELFVSPIGEGALVIFERDGSPLPASEGPLALVSLRDTQPGPRHVKWLEKIEIRRVSD